MTKSYNKQYNAQAATAKFRNIDWQFTYETWIEWWGDDIINRGRYDGKLVMARHNDTGPYNPDNVRKALCNENSAEAHKGKKRPRTKEHQAKLNESMRNRIVTDETRQKLREFNLGKKQSEETRNKRSEAIKAWWASKKSIEV